jgi:hypothetical protein
MYRQIAVAIIKKHLPGIVQPFDPHTPRDRDGLLRLLSFQTGHNPATHAGAYALDRAYPAKLQPELVEQYLEVSKVWHQFLDVDRESTDQAILSFSANRSLLEAPVEQSMFLPPNDNALSTNRIAQTRELPQESTVLQIEASAAGENERSRKRSRDSDESMSPTQQKINALRADLAALEHEHKMQKLCKAACQQALTNQGAEDPNGTLGYRKRGSQVSLSNCADVFCFLEDFKVFVCKQHHTAVMNLDRHMLQYHKVPASVRRQVVDCFSRLEPVDPSKIKLSKEPTQAIEQLGKPLAGLECRACGYITVSKDQIWMHCNRDHQLAWLGDKSQVYNSVKVQSFFRTGGLQKYFIVV